MLGKVTTPASSNGSSWERPCESDWTKMETNRLKSSCSNGAHENIIIEPHRVQRRLTRTTSRTEVRFPCVPTTWCINRCPYRQWTFLRQKPLSTVSENCRHFKLGTSSNWTAKQRWYAEQHWKASSFYHMNRLRSSREFRIWRKSSNSTRGRAVLRSDIVKDDSGNYAVCTATVLDVISRLAGCSGEASDAAGAYTQDEMKDAPELLHLSEEDYLKIWIRLPKAGRPQHEDSIDDPVVPLERNLFHWGVRRFEKHVLFSGNNGKTSLVGALLSSKNAIILVSVYVEDMRMARSTQHMPKMWAKQDQRKSICTTQCHSLIRCILDVLNEQHKSKTDLVVEKQKVFSKLISSNTDVKIEKKKSQRHHSLDLRHGRPRSKVFWKLLRIGAQDGWPPFLDDHHVKKEDLEMVGELSYICGPIGWKCLYLARIWRPGFLWKTSEGKLRRAQQARELPPEDWKVGRVCTERPTHMRSFQRLCFQIHLGAFRTLSALLWFKVGLSKSFHQVIIADLLYLSATEATPTTLTSCAYSSVTFFGVSTPRCLSEWTFHRQTQAVSPTVRLIWSEGLFQ